MPLSEHADQLGPELFRAIERKGYADLTAVQLAVLDPALAGRDLRITSQTGSGKTLAIGLSLRQLANQESPAIKGVAAPRALVVAPTRELAHQVEQELTWLYAESGIRLATTTGGASYRDEHRALSRGPAVIVGTPGRLLDHLQRGSIDASQVTTVVLDEADRMLDLGFRDDLEALFKRVPEARTTHLVSATFPRVVRAFADRLQREPAHVEGTRLGAANADIDHVIHVVAPDQRLDALVNILLANPEDQTLVFVRTRADAAHIANELVVTGFAASALSGEMEQAARNRALAAFKLGGLRVLVATDVAARGIDVQGVTRVIHGELPTNPDAYTHRSGRTGRAGRKGTSSLLVAPIGVVRAARLLRGLGINHRMEPIPTAREILDADDARLFAELTQDGTAPDAEQAGDSAPASGPTPEALAKRWAPLAARLIEAGELERTMGRLLALARKSVTAPRNVRAFPHRGPNDGRDRFERPTSDNRDNRDKRGPRDTRNSRDAYNARDEYPRRERPDARRDTRRDAAPKPREAAHSRDRERPDELRDVQRDDAATPREAAHSRELERPDELRDVRPDAAPSPREPAHPRRERPDARRDAAPTPREAAHPRERTRPADTSEAPRSRAKHAARDTHDARDGDAAPAENGYTSFHVSWGERSGADPRRLLAMLCRRGQIRGRDVGAIRVESNYSLVQVSNDVVPVFARAASRPDPREPEIVIRADRAQSAGELAETRSKLRAAPGRGAPKPPHRPKPKGPSARVGDGHRPLKRNVRKARGR